MHRDTECIRVSDDKNESIVPYERLISMSEVSNDSVVMEAGTEQSSHVLINFLIMSTLFSANHGAMVSCLAFSTLQLGSTGAWELSLLHLVYAASALLGATYVVKQFGARNSMAIGMALYASYVLCFWLALQWQIRRNELAVVGAIMGGIGGGIVWTAQGSYFSKAANDYARACVDKSVEEATSFLAGVFACIYLFGEVVCKLMSWVVLEWEHLTWTNVIGVYTVVAVASTVLMSWVHNYPMDTPQHDISMTYKLTSALQLLVQNPKMKFLVGLNAVFGLACPFVNSFVNGEVVQQVIKNDSNLHVVGLFSAMSAGVAAICSLLFGHLSKHKGAVLTFGAFSFTMVSMLFLIQPDFSKWGLVRLLLVYAFQGIGRSTFEGALRAVFADYFSDEKEGAFANIILQNGFFTALGFFLSFNVPCRRKSDFCIEFKEGGFHNVLVLEVAVVISAVLAVVGFWRASSLFKVECVHSEVSTEIINPLLETSQFNECTDYVGVPLHATLQRRISKCKPSLPEDEVGTISL